MKERLVPICIPPNTTIRDTMRAITDGPRNDPPSPSGIALITQDDRLLGIATDGDIRKAILKGHGLDEPIETVMKRDPLTVPHAAEPDVILARFHDALRNKAVSASQFHHIITTDEQGKVIDVVTPFELWRLSEVKIKTVAVIGLGYVGLTLALTLNEFGIRVIGVDVNEKTIDSLKKGIPHFYEKGLEQLLKKHANKLLILSTELHEHESDIFIICVGTPVDARGRVNMDPLTSSATAVGKMLKPHDIVILRSTVPIGTCRKAVLPILEKYSGLKAGTEFSIAFAPERTVEGKALEELRTLPQVIGGFNRQSLNEATKLFQIFAKMIVGVDSLEEAEAVKLLNNTFRDVSFGFANEVALAMHGHGLSARNIIRAANEGYVRNPIPLPSPGVGGACLVKDPHLFAASAREGGYVTRLPLAARSINESMVDFVVRKVDRFIEETWKDPATAKLFIMGLAFKGTPETSDIRFSPSVDILQKLKSAFDHVFIYDPVAHRHDLEQLGATVVERPEEGFAGADCVLVLNNHPSYAELPIFTLANTMRSPALLFDPWGSYLKEQLTGLDHVQYSSL